MARRRKPRVAVVIKRTTYRKFVLEVHDPLIARLLRRRDPTVGRLKQSHEDHESTAREVEDALDALGAEIVFRGGPRARVPARTDLVVTVGGDGTLLAASHLLGDGVPLLGINSAPGHSVGFFCGATKGNVRATIERALEGNLATTELTRMRVELNGKLLHGRVLNEALFCHSSPAATSRYILRLRSGEEEQRSSGLWIGPAAGSTAAQRSAGGRILPLESERIQYVVREPYTPAGGRFRYARGLVDAGQELVLRSKMREAKVFLDGHRLVHSVTMGDVLTMRRSDEALTVLGIARKRRV
ncbi:MAG: NAD(+)/NADH kinase [Labilithrix sp.]|nr:NAD(+)/NADH kinase [Labilithrix sp.]MBX3221086.1 NAD(+)/NADH kinase [Labilithrix sp.]